MSVEAKAMNRRVFVRIHGIVQGVGFRPYIFQLAHHHRLGGWVRNQSNGVELEVAGGSGHIEAFLRDLPVKAPPLARIVTLDVSERVFTPFERFEIVSSSRTQSRSTLIAPDVCTCADCLRELLDPNDRRYRYPFINCTNCGPRYTIIQDIPYDRDKTTMAPFAMCPECRREYEDPMNRRFHAQPNACWTCGPQVWLEDAAGETLARREEAIRRAGTLLDRGAILAVKGLGGFHLAVSALDEKAVSRLRTRKIREEKPFAVMFRDRSTARRACVLSEREEALLLSPERPIVLARRREDDGSLAVAPSVAPGNRNLGVFLAYTPLHALLFLESSCDALVMTSGNQSDEPIVMDNDAARSRLASIADAFLLHDREIYMRCDDSVVRVLNGEPRPVRRARGWVPVPVFLEASGPSVLGVGAELKSTICLTRGREAFLSQHIGDLENLETLHSFEHTIAHLERILEIKPEAIIHDLHPDYLSTQWALAQTGRPLFAVQHHHAHIAAVLAEHRLSGPILGLALDGTGYGTDGTIWGGELLRVEADRFDRLGCLRQVPLPGGGQAVKEPWRMALSYLWSLDPEAPERTFQDFFSRWPKDKARVLLQMLHRRLNSPLTSSCGRLFDAVAALAGVRDSITFEGQAAIELEQAIEPGETGCYEGNLRKEHETLILDPFPMIAGVVRDVRQGCAVGIVSARFHNGLTRLLVDALVRARQETGLERVALSGGVFQNATLSEHLEKELEARGIEVYSHREVPANDACIALGQAWIGVHRLKAAGPSHAPEVRTVLG